MSHNCTLFWGCTEGPASLLRDLLENADLAGEMPCQMSVATYDVLCVVQNEIEIAVAKARVGAGPAPRQMPATWDLARDESVRLVATVFLAGLVADQSDPDPSGHQPQPPDDHVDWMDTPAGSIDTNALRELISTPAAKVSSDGVDPNSLLGRIRNALGNP